MKRESQNNVEGTPISNSSILEAEDLAMACLESFYNERSFMTSHL